MTPEQIRETNERGTERDIAIWLKEIAMQLAVWNERENLKEERLELQKT